MQFGTWLNVALIRYNGPEDFKKKRSFMSIILKSDLLHLSRVMSKAVSCIFDWWSNRGSAGAQVLQGLAANCSLYLGQANRELGGKTFL